MINNQKKNKDKKEDKTQSDFGKLQLSYQHSSSKDHSPVDDAIPERLPQDRLTRTVESWGLIES